MLKMGLGLIPVWPFVSVSMSSVTGRWFSRVTNMVLPDSPTL
jgi:hypothetical protein